ncbi:unnamed protein product, partial [Coccothraustes coccothraustes]
MCDTDTVSWAFGTCHGNAVEQHSGDQKQPLGCFRGRCSLCPCKLFCPLPCMGSVLPVHLYEFLGFPLKTHTGCEDLFSF